MPSKPRSLAGIIHYGRAADAEYNRARLGDPDRGVEDAVVSSARAAHTPRLGPSAGSRGSDRMGAGRDVFACGWRRSGGHLWTFEVRGPSVWRFPVDTHHALPKVRRAEPTFVASPRTPLSRLTHLRSTPTELADAELSTRLRRSVRCADGGAFEAQETFLDPRVRTAGRALLTVKLDRAARPELATSLGVKATPAIVVLRPDGSVATRLEGAIKASPLTKALEAAVSK